MADPIEVYELIGAKSVRSSLQPAVARGLSRFELRAALLQIVEFARVHQIVLEAEALARELNDPRRLAQALAYLSSFFYFSGQLDRALESGEGALAQGEELHDVGVQVFANRLLGMSYTARTDYDRAVECLSKSLRLVNSRNRQFLLRGVDQGHRCP